MYIINHDTFLAPSYRISPFRTCDIAFNKHLPFDNEIDGYFKSRFKEREFTYTLSGRSALNMALKYYNLQKDDLVTILTTTGNFYISSCVTKEIEKYCKWSRNFESKTKLILVNHEFGYLFEDIIKLKEHDLPIIEDCAHSFFSKDKDCMAGTIGDFVIYSFPKIFPIQIGGLLVSKKSIHDDEFKFIDMNTMQYIKKVLSFYIRQKDDIISKRIYNYKYLRDQLSAQGLYERFELRSGIVPGVFMFKANEQTIDLPRLKEHMQKHGIESSVFYDESSFFLPVHQNLGIDDLDYFIHCLRNFIVNK